MQDAVLIDLVLLLRNTSIDVTGGPGCLLLSVDRGLRKGTLFFVLRADVGPSGQVLGVVGRYECEHERPKLKAQLIPAQA